MSALEMRLLVLLELEFLREQEHGKTLPKPAFKDLKTMHPTLKLYWEIIGADYLQYYVLSYCAASETGVEPVFSTEGLFHDDVRSSMSPLITKTVIRIRYRTTIWSNGGMLC